MSDDLGLFIGRDGQEKTPEPNQPRQKIKISLAVGSIVEVYSSTSDRWMDARVDRIRGDKLCVVYLESNAMKWLKKTSRQLRLKADIEAQARDLSRMDLPDSSRKLRLSISGLESGAAKPTKRASAYLPSMVPPPPKLADNRSSPNPSQPPPPSNPPPPSDPPPPAGPPPQRRGSYQPSAMTPPPPSGPIPDQIVRQYSAGSLDRGRAMSAPGNSEYGTLVKQHSSPARDMLRGLNEGATEDEFLSREMTLQWSPQPPTTNFTNVGLFGPNAVTHDYDVTFEEPVLGITINPLTPDGLNAVVTNCLIPHTQRNVTVNSRIVAVNKRSVIGAPYETIKEFLRTGARNPPLVVTFRSETERVLRGTLKIKVIQALHLRPPGSYATVQVNQSQLTTQTVAANEHPEWNESFTFKNFRPSAGKMATAACWKHNRLLKDTMIGEAEFQLPTEFDQIDRTSLELVNKRGDLAGVLTISCAVLTPRKERKS